MKAKYNLEDGENVTIAQYENNNYYFALYCTGLQTTVNNLNTTLTNANTLIVGLQQTNTDLQSTIKKVGNTADAATGFF